MQRSTFVKFLADLLLTSLSFSSESESFSVVFDFLQPQGILQARILEWLAFPFSRGSSWPRNQTRVSCIAGRFFTNWAIGEALSFSRWMFSSTLACSHFVSHLEWTAVLQSISFTISVLLISLYFGYLKKELVFRNFTNCDCEHKYILNRLNFLISFPMGRIRGKWWMFVEGKILLLLFFNFLWEGNGTPLQYSCLENPMGSGA